MCYITESAIDHMEEKSSGAHTCENCESKTDYLAKITYITVEAEEKQEHEGIQAKEYKESLCDKCYWEYKENTNIVIL
jgi:hypothetical protein